MFCYSLETRLDAGLFVAEPTHSAFSCEVSQCWPFRMKANGLPDQVNGRHAESFGAISAANGWGATHVPHVRVGIPKA